MVEYAISGCLERPGDRWKHNISHNMHTWDLTYTRLQDGCFLHSLL